MIAAAYVIAGFLLGSIPFGLLIGRLFFKTDIRTSGSGNIGTVNALRSLGKTAGVAVLICDAAKGALPTLAAIVAGLDPWAIAAVAAAAVLGHSFSPWLRGKGGKGVATALGALLALCWPAALAFAAVWLAAVMLTRYSSLGSLLGIGAAAIVMASLRRDPAWAALGLFLVAFIAYTHRENIGRLRGGSENPLHLFSRPR